MFYKLIQMKKKIAILSLVAIFASAGALTAQTKTVTSSTSKTEEKTVTAKSPCCKGKTAKCCKGKAAKCCKDKPDADKAKCAQKCKK